MVKTQYLFDIADARFYPRCDLPRSRFLDFQFAELFIVVFNIPQDRRCGFRVRECLRGFRLTVLLDDCRDSDGLCATFVHHKIGEMNNPAAREVYGELRRRAVDSEVGLPGPGRKGLSRPSSLGRIFVKPACPDHLIARPQISEQRRS